MQNAYSGNASRPITRRTGAPGKRMIPAWSQSMETAAISFRIKEDMDRSFGGKTVLFSLLYTTLEKIARSNRRKSARCCVKSTKPDPGAFFPSASKKEGRENPSRSCPKDSVDFQRFAFRGEAASPDLLDLRHGDERLRIDLLNQLRGGVELAVRDHAEDAFLLLFEASRFDHGHRHARFQLFQKTAADLFVLGRDGENLDLVRPEQHHPIEYDGFERKHHDPVQQLLRLVEKRLSRADLEAMEYTWEYCYSRDLDWFWDPDGTWVFSWYQEGKLVCMAYVSDTAARVTIVFDYLDRTPDDEGIHIYTEF